MSAHYLCNFFNFISNNRSERGSNTSISIRHVHKYVLPRRKCALALNLRSSDVKTYKLK